MKEGCPVFNFLHFSSGVKGKCIQVHSCLGLISCSFSAFPAILLGFTILGEIFAYVTVF